MNHREGAPEERESRRGTFVLSFYGPTMSTHNFILWRSGKLMASLPSPLSLPLRPMLAYSRLAAKRTARSHRFGLESLPPSTALVLKQKRFVTKTNSASHRFLFPTSSPTAGTPQCYNASLYSPSSWNCRRQSSKGGGGKLTRDVHSPPRFPLSAVQPGGPHLACVTCPRIAVKATVR